MNGRPMCSPGQRVIVMVARIVIELADCLVRAANNNGHYSIDYSNISWYPCNSLSAEGQPIYSKGI